MIPITPQPQPSDFYKKVQQKGQNFLNNVPHPTTDQWEGREYWRDALPDMRQAYKNTCAYCGQWMSHPTANPTIDHYLARKHRPELAYQWSNFRLCCSILNSKKGTHADILDPFTLNPDWFTLDFSSWLIRPNPALAGVEKAQVQATIDRLQLNDDEAFVQSRIEWYQTYKQQHCSFAFLEKRAPFIAYEARRQGRVP